MGASLSDVQVDSGNVYRADPPQLRVVSSLAEGADRIVAQEALALGYELDCPLPFERFEYERDFADQASIAEYRALLAKARSVLELDGTREVAERQTAAYQAAGLATLDHADLLIAIWDGGEARGAGGRRRSLTRPWNSGSQPFASTPIRRTAFAF